MNADFTDDHITITFIALQELLDRSAVGGEQERLANGAIKKLLEAGYWPTPR